MRAMSRPVILKLSISAFAVVFALALLEAAVRLQCFRDGDGAWRFRSTRLKPYRLPVARVERDMALLQTTDKSLLLYDPELGWRPRPGLVDHNAAGFRTTGGVPEKLPTEGVLRIALFGDSYTEGSATGGWWRVLEERMNAAGVKCEVLNFGVGGYGMDQAYLRWKKEGVGWQPHVVILGFFADDCYRNLNLLRLLRDPDSGIPVMKPRFILEGDGLRLVNSPTPTPPELAAVVRAFPVWPLAEHEHFFHAEDFRETLWRRSRLGALIEAKAGLAGLAAEAEKFFRPEGEAGQVTLRLLRQMQGEVTAAGAAFYVAHLPSLTDLTDIKLSGRMPQSDLLAQVRSEHEVIDIAPALLAAGEGHEYREFFLDGHYREDFHRFAGEVIATALLRVRPQKAVR